MKSSISERPADATYSCWLGLGEKRHASFDCLALRAHTCSRSAVMQFAASPFFFSLDRDSCSLVKCPLCHSGLRLWWLGHQRKVRKRFTDDVGFGSPAIRFSRGISISSWLLRAGDGFKFLLRMLGYLLDLARFDPSIFASRSKLRLWNLS